MEEKETKLKRRWEREREARQNESEIIKKNICKVGGKNNFIIIAKQAIILILSSFLCYAFPSTEEMDKQKAHGKSIA